MKSYSVYILANKRNGTLYIGMTSDLPKRARQHKAKATPGFTSRYEVNKLVYFEQTGDAVSAARRERQMKKWNRAWKIRLIEKGNPQWVDLSPTLLEK